MLLYNSILAILMAMSWYLIVVLTCSSLFIKKVEHLFVYLLTFWISSLMEWTPLSIFLLGDLIYDFFMYFRYKFYLLYVVNICSHFSATFFILVFWWSIVYHSLLLGLVLFVPCLNKLSLLQGTFLYWF